MKTLRPFSDADDLDRALGALDEMLRSFLDVYLIGGAAVIAHGVHDRGTMDIDAIFPESFPAEVEEQIARVGAKLRLPDHWLNTMPSRDLRFLRSGWRERSITVFRGKLLHVQALGRTDLLGLKLAAALDRREPDRSDILALRPTDDEMEGARLWARAYDTNPDWPDTIDRLVKEILDELKGA